eukprot:CAMPEP_0201530032 /NCGR_PEP_ID=MMETSP0161_2-20130828/43528_1 /ASSEMBLY_ACC=CAM_ASM_000251 /TAXON_ID=180227 /ORGANISM="Neoparamoeba aestuarina, Strain SoJaBio B1-5/56/2" /LENGTH=91 /DNA_ID=CAMNT_0047932153 /DNA_START=798 /DNA_END=1071 /DNA_ORIENTATION=-
MTSPDFLISLSKKVKAVICNETVLLLINFTNSRHTRRTSGSELVGMSKDLVIIPEGEGGGGGKGEEREEEGETEKEGLGEEKRGVTGEEVW